MKAYIRALAITSLLSLGATSVAGPAVASTPSPTPAWAAHVSSVAATRPVVLSLTRHLKEACKLKITSPRSVVRIWSYAAGSGVIKFGVTPARTTVPGKWSFSSACTPTGSSIARTATTSIKVTGSSGSGFITGPHGPVIFVPVGYGTTGRTASLASQAGKGGDPGNDYPYAGQAQDSSFDPWREYVRECTSFAAWALHSRNNFDVPFFANAADWGPKAQARGVTVDNSPAVGSIAWSNRGYYGHVAWVLDVIGSSVTIEEYNYDGNGHYNKRTVNAAAFTGYIHFADRPSAPAAPADPPPSTTSQQPPPQQQPQPQPAPAKTYSETTGGSAHTWTDYTNAGGTQGPGLASNQTVQIACRVTGYRVPDGDTWWYLVNSSPWNNAYFATADAFYNNGQTSGSLTNTPFVDQNVPICQQAGSSGGGSSTPPPPPPPVTYNETTGGTTNTWTDYHSAGGAQGPSIASNQTVQVTCKVTGFQVADGDTWWYFIASSPWNNSYYASADAFYNNGSTSGSLHGTPFVDNAVPNC